MQEVVKKAKELVKAIEDEAPRKEIEEKAEELQDVTDFKGQSASSSGSTAKSNHVTSVAPQPDPEKDQARKAIDKLKHNNKDIPKKSLEDIPSSKKKEEDKPKPKEPTEEEKEKVIARMRTAKSNATIEQEIRDYKAMKPLTKDELKWVKVTALGLSRTGNLSDGQLARYKARFDRAKHNNQKYKRPKGLSLII